MISRILMISACTVILLTSSALAGKVNLSFDHYYNEAEIHDALKQLNKAYPELTELRSLGKSEEGRDIMLFTINNSNTGNDLEKPAVYVDGTIHGNEIQATEVCLYLAWYLLDSYGTNEVMTKLVDTRAFYIVPIVNVDNRERLMSQHKNYGIGRSAIVPYDDDRDGLFDEDDYDDVDGDGEILQMRIRDPQGNFKTHPDDPRVMVRIKPGEKGEWRQLGREGIDNDGDGRINEDTPGYLDMNRNYGFKWQPPYVQSGAGDFPLSAKPNEAITKFVLTKPNICFDFAFHNSGGLWVRGPGSKLAGMYSPRDVAVYDYLGGEGEKIVPGYEYIIGSLDMYTTHGDFDEFMYSGLGVFGFVGELYMGGEQMTYRPRDVQKEIPDYWGNTYETDRDREKMLFSDRVYQGNLFKDWKKYNHPQLGEIEIGGWRTYASRITPPFQLLEQAHRCAAMVIFTAQNTPEVSLELIEVKDLGDGIKRVRVAAKNSRAIPSLSDKAMKNNLTRKDIFKIEGRGVEIVAGGFVSDLLYDRVDYVDHRPFILFSNVPSFGIRNIEWIVKGSGKVTVTFDAVKAANRTLNIDL
ncbi:MAG: M14 family metallopeptidase [Candidatus Zixiibacteriota bacterium]